MGEGSVVSPLRATETEAVGKLASQGRPVLLPLLLGKLEKGVVEVLQVLVLLDNGRVLLPTAARSVSSATAAAAAATATSATVLPLHNRSVLSIGCADGRNNRSTYPKVLPAHFVGSAFLGSYGCGCFENFQAASPVAKKKRVAGGGGGGAPPSPAPRALVAGKREVRVWREPDEVTKGRSPLIQSFRR